MLRIALLVSGTGSNMMAIHKSITSRELPIELVCVIGDRNCPAIDKANHAGITTRMFDRKTVNVSEAIMEYLEGKVDLIVMTGFLSIISENFCRRWKNKIINIHPSLLPKYGGSGMWGPRVHTAVLINAEKFTGATVHHVNETIDGGEIIMQRSMEIPKGVSVNELQRIILEEVEHQLIIDVLKKFAREHKNV